MVPSVVLLFGVLQVIFLGFGIYMMKKNPLLDGIGGGCFHSKLSASFLFGVANEGQIS